MVNREARDQAARALRRFLDCETTNEEFDGEYARIGPIWNKGKDRAIPAVYGFAWNLYDDFEEHKLEGAYEPDEPVRAMAERCVLFLSSELEYRWKRTKFIGIDWRRILSGFLPSIKWEEDPMKRFEAFMDEPDGEASVWPFYRREHYDAVFRG